MGVRGESERLRSGGGFLERFVRGRIVVGRVRNVIVSLYKNI